MVDLNVLLSAFPKRLSTAYQNQVLRHPIPQSKIGLTKLQTNNLIPRCFYMDTNLKSLPEREIM